MLHDLNGFWPVRPGSDSMLYFALRGPLRASRVSGYLGRQISVCALTEGFPGKFWGILMGWGRVEAVEPVLNWVLDQYRGDPEVQDLARANALSVTRADGMDWIRTVLRRNPYYRGEVPVWTRRALRELRSELGEKDGAKAVARVLTEDLCWGRSKVGRGGRVVAVSKARAAKWLADSR